MSDKIIHGRVFFQHLESAPVLWSIPDTMGTAFASIWIELSVPEYDTFAPPPPPSGH